MERRGISVPTLIRLNGPMREQAGTAFSEMDTV